MANKSAADRWSPGIVLGRGISGPMQAVGGFVLDVRRRRSVCLRPAVPVAEFLEQSWFVARVSLAPTLLVAIPFTVLVSFT